MCTQSACGLESLSWVVTTECADRNEKSDAGFIVSGSQVDMDALLSRYPLIHDSYEGVIAYEHRHSGTTACADRAYVS